MIYRYHITKRGEISQLSYITIIEASQNITCVFFGFQDMSFMPIKSLLAGASASLVGVVTIGIVTMKYIFRNYPRFPNSNSPQIYTVASMKGCRLKNQRKTQLTSQFQIFYPCDRIDLDRQNSTYMRSNAVEGLCRSFGNSVILRYILKSILINKLATHLMDGYSKNITPLIKQNRNKGKRNAEVKWPVVLFSHGLFGSMELYSTICSEIASYGFVVVAPEHEDGSASYAEVAMIPESTICDISIETNRRNILKDNGAEQRRKCDNMEEYFEKYVIAYKKPEGVTYSNKESVVGFRKPFLLKRYEEICDIINALVELTSCPNDADDSNSTSNNERLLNEENRLRDVMLNTNLTYTNEGSIILAGHSFGGSTIQFTMHQLSQDIKNKIKGVKVESLLLLDTWVSPVPNEILSQKFQIPTLNIFCETFVTWTPSKVLHELEGVEEILQANRHSNDGNNETFQCVAIRGTKHQFFSDVPYWFPKIISRYAGVSGKTDIEISRSCLKKVIAKFLLEEEASAEFVLTDEEMSYVYDVNEAMLNPPSDK